MQADARAPFLQKPVLSQTSPEMTARIGAFPWSDTPLGPLDSWSPALRSMVENMLANGFAMLLWWGPEFVQFYNDAYRPVLGAKHPAALGQRGADCWWEFWEQIRPLAERPFFEGLPSVVGDLELVMHRNGFPEETHFTVAYSPVFDDTVQSGIGGVLATIEETTGTVVGERRIRLLRELGSRTAEAKSTDEVCTSAMAAVATAPRDIPFASLYLYGQNDTLEFADAAGNPPNAAQEKIREAIARNAMVVDGRAAILPIASTSERPYGVLVAGISPNLPFDATYAAFLELLVTPISTAITNVRAYEAERRRAEELAELDRAKIEFFSNVSHEFRTPLTLMLGPLDDLERSADEDQRPLVETARRNSLRLLKLVNTLLEFSRLEAGRSDALFVPTDLGRLTSDLVAVFRSAIESQGLRLLEDVDAGAVAYVDRSMWEKIVLNLLSNALKFTLEGEIRVTLRRLEDAVELCVSDTGVGIPEAEMPRLFERFHRIRGAQSRSHEGSGIGLALVNELVRLHGGEIRVQSELAKGTAFTLSIPRGNAHLDPERIATGDTPTYVSSVDNYLADVEATIQPSAGRATRPLSGAATGDRILFVDDNHDLRDYAERILSTRYDVTTVTNGVHALQMLRSHAFDLVISDVMMPEMDGFELLRAVRNDPSLAQTKFILLSARAGEGSQVEGLEQGADDYLIKPFSSDQLLARVGSHLRSERRDDEASSARVLGRWFERPGDADAKAAAFRVFADQLPIMMFLLDATGAVSFTNRVWHRTLHLPKTSYAHTLEAWRSVIHPDDVARTLGVISAAISSHSPWELEYRLKPSDGGNDSYRWHTARGVPYHDVDGTFLGWTGSIIDVHEARLREDAERKLRVEATRGAAEFRALAETIPLMVWTSDATGWLDWYNRRWYDYTGQTPEEAAGWGWQAAHHPDDLPAVMERWPNSIATGEPFEMEFRLRKFDGSFHTFLTRAVPVRDDEGRVVRWYGSNIDIQNQKIELERSKRIADTLQALFLPQELPHTDRIRIDAVYQAAEPDALVGGDWFDAAILHDGRCLVSIGDVAGHGLGASIIAGRLRQSILGFALEETDPANVLARANRVLRFQHPEIFATAFVGFLDPDATELTYANSGHPPPLIVLPESGGCSFFPFGDLPLGIEEDAGYVTRNVAIPRDSIVALYTDGIIEYDRDIAQAQERLERAIVRLAGDGRIARPAIAVRNEVLGDARTIDDAAIMIVQFSFIPADDIGSGDAPLEKSWRFHSSDANAARASRHELMRFIRRYAVASPKLFDTELILGEMLANTVEHAPGLVEVHVDWSEDRPTVTVSDTGPGIDDCVVQLPADEFDENGRGLFLIATLADAFTVEPALGYGTLLRATLPVRRRK